MRFNSTRFSESSVVKSNVEGDFAHAISQVPSPCTRLTVPGIPLTAVLEIGLAPYHPRGASSISGREVALAVGVRALDEFLLDPRLVLAVVLCGTVTRYLEDLTYVCDIIGPVAPVTADLTGINFERPPE